MLLQKEAEIIADGAQEAAHDHDGPAAILVHQDAAYGPWECHNTIDKTDKRKEVGVWVRERVWGGGGR